MTCTLSDAGCRCWGVGGCYCLFVLRCHRVITYKVDRSSAHRVGFIRYTRGVGRGGGVGGVGRPPLFGGEF